MAFGGGTKPLVYEAATLPENLGELKEHLKNGEDPNGRFNGDPALSAAARFGNVEAVEVLLKAGAKPKGTGPSGRGALFCASLWGRPACVKALLAAGAGNHQTDKDEALEVAREKSNVGYGPTAEDYVECIRLLGAK